MKVHQCLLDADQLELRVLAQLLVERGERLIEQQQLGLCDQRPGERDALPLPARGWCGLRFKAGRA